MLIESTELRVPAGEMIDADYVIDLAAILRSEVRQAEVAIVTPAKAPELLAEFNKSWLAIHDVIARLEAEKNKADKAAKKRRAVVLLEIVPKVLEEKKLSTAADVREAIILTDDEYEILTDRFDQIKAAIFFLKGKMESFENAYTSTKKIMGEDSYNMHGKPLSGGTENRGEPRLVSRPQTPPASAGARAGFGTPRFDK